MSHPLEGSSAAEDFLRLMAFGEATATFPVWSPFGAFEAAEIMLAALASKVAGRPASPSDRDATSESAP